MPYAPGISYHGDQYINQGFRSMADVVNQGRAQQQQQRQFDQRMDLEKSAMNLGYYSKEQDRALDYYKLNEEGFTPDPAHLRRMEELGYYFAPQSKRGGNYYPVPQKGQDESIIEPIQAQPVLDADGKPLAHVYRDPFSGKSVKIPLPSNGNVWGMPPVGGDVTNPNEKQKAEALLKEREELKAKIEAGDQYFGPDWLGLGKPRSAQLTAVERQLQELGGKQQEPPPRPTPAARAQPPAATPPPAAPAASVEPPLPTNAGLPPDPSVLAAQNPLGLPPKNFQPLPKTGMTGTLQPVTTQAQFDALPSGTKYRGANGKTYVKP